MKGNLWNHGKWQNKLLTLLTICALVLASITGQSFPLALAASTASSKIPYTITLNGNQLNASVTNIDHAENMKDGAILHAWCWSFNTIKQNMAAIKEAGYTSIQTSPVNNCVVGNGGDLKFTEQWYYHYQPTDYKIGNYQLGSEAEFAAMCQEAEKYGIKIIVDVVANHCSSAWNTISNNIKNIPNVFHTNQQISNWNDRYQVTQLALLGLYDNNTHNKTLQNYIKSYLNRCIELGADGFRYDAAKHIELPDDPGYGSDFWPTILNNSAEFQYGEILQDNISRESSYANYMSVTASNYGKNMRDAIGANDFSTTRIMNYAINAPADKLVTWVESHDNYANAIDEWGSSEWMNDEQIKLTWAAVAARKNGTPLFFSRPVGGGGKSWDNRFPEITKMGDRGSSLFMDDEVAAVNKFRNAMVGENEYLRNPNGNSKILMIERGSKGAVIINLNYNDTYLSSNTNLANGSYKNQTDNNNIFNVSNNTITGTLPARSVVVLYDYNSDSPSVSIADCPSAFRTDSTTLTLQCTNTVKATYSVNGSASYLYDNGDSITIGSGDAYNTTYTIELRGINQDGVTTKQVYTITKKDPNAMTTIYFQKPTNWSNNMYAYVYDESGAAVVNNAAWPGVSMSYDSATGYYKYSCPNDFTQAKVIFTDGTNQAPGANLPGYDVKDNMLYNTNGESGTIIVPTTTPTVQPSPSIQPTPSVTPSVTPTTPVGTDQIYFSKPSSWGDTIYAYVYDESGASVVTNASWPGVSMTRESNGEYSYVLNKNVTSTSKVIFNDGSNQTSASGFAVTKNGHYNSDGLIGGTTKNTITVYYKTGWNTAFIHYKVGNGSWTTAPGVKMSASDRAGYKSITIDLGSQATLTACFNNGNGSWDSNYGSNYYFGSTGTYTVKDGVLTKQ